MNDDRLTTALGSFYKGTAPTPPDPELGLERVMTRVQKTRQRGRWWPLPALDRPVSTFPSRELVPAPIPATTGPTPVRRFTMFSAVKVVVASVILAVFGGFLLAGVLTTPDGEVLPAAVTDSPSPMTSEELLAGMVTEEVEPGVFRVANDGVRDLSSLDGWHICAGHDGSIWLEVTGDLVRLGGTQITDPRVEEFESLFDLEVAPDGTVWATVLSDGEGSRLRSFDGQSWTTHSGAEPTWEDHEVLAVEVSPRGRVWTVSSYGVIGYLEADGATWHTTEAPKFWNAIDLLAFTATDSEVWVPQWTTLSHFADGAWESSAYGGLVSGSMPDGAFWALAEGRSGSHGDLHRHDGAGWQRWVLEELGMAPWATTPWSYRTAPDGSFWAGWDVNASDGGVNDPCDGVSRFDGRSRTRYLSGLCINRLDIAPDGSVWLLAREGDHSRAALDSPQRIYVITPEAVPATG